MPVLIYNELSLTHSMVTATVNSIKEGVEFSQKSGDLGSGDTRHQVRIRRNVTEEQTSDFHPVDQFHLHAVLVHDGQFGGQNLYSYVRPSSGEWWKLAYNKATLVRNTSRSSRTWIVVSSTFFFVGLRRNRAQ